jgi:hypothetical protein
MSDVAMSNGTPPNRLLNNLSVATVPLETFTESGVSIEKATGFFYKEQNGAIWLITNWHVVTNRIPLQPRHSKTGAIPYILKIKLHQHRDDGGFTLSDKWLFSFQINDAEGNDPKWFEHPSLRYRFDVVAFPFSRQIQPLDKSHFFVLSEHPTFREDFYPEVMMDAFVIGYPWAIDGGDGVLPIFKRGSVASEPSIDQGGLPRFLIDCRTAPGLSGAPVIASYSGLWSPPHLQGGGMIGTVQNFVGCYSGRLETRGETQSDDVSELGIVWKREGIDAMISGGVLGTTLTELIS